MIYWFTGQPGSGKTTLAEAWTEENEGDMWTVDADVVRKIWPTGYTESERRANVGRVQFQALSIAGMKDEWHISVACVAPYRDQRDWFKSFSRFPVVEVYLMGNPGGKREYWVDDYEMPHDADLELDTDRMSVEECVVCLRRVHRGMCGLGVQP